MNKNKFTALASTLLLSTALCSTNVFADNPYGIDYSRGEPLNATNVTINPNLITGLTPIINSSAGTFVEMQGRWESGYLRDHANNTCHPVSYIMVTDTTRPSSFITVQQDNYMYDIEIMRIYLEDSAISSSNPNEWYSVAFSKPSAFNVGDVLYSDAACTTLISGSKALSAQNADKIFLELGVRVRNALTLETIYSDQMYLGITDIDSGQSFKIENTDNRFTKENMFAMSAGALQPTSGTDMNMFNPGDHYIYSQGYFAITSGANIYTKLTEDGQHHLDLIFGFNGPAASGIHYYAKQYTVTYMSDENGQITGITTEPVISNNNPTGTFELPDDNFFTTHWIADVTVNLDDGRTIEAGKPLTAEQIKRVIVHQDITFTVFHDTGTAPNTPTTPPTTDIPKVPNTSTGLGIEKISVIAVTLGIAVIAIVSAVVVKLYPWIFRKRVSFKKRK